MWGSLQPLERTPGPPRPPHGAPARLWPPGSLRYFWEAGRQHGSSGAPARPALQSPQGAPWPGQSYKHQDQHSCGIRPHGHFRCWPVCPHQPCVSASMCHLRNPVLLLPPMRQREESAAPGLMGGQPQLQGPGTQVPSMLVSDLLSLLPSCPGPPGQARPGPGSQHHLHCSPSSQGPGHTAWPTLHTLLWASRSETAEGKKVPRQRDKTGSEGRGQAKAGRQGHRAGKI